MRLSTAPDVSPFKRKVRVSIKNAHLSANLELRTEADQQEPFHPGLLQEGEAVTAQHMAAVC